MTLAPCVVPQVLLLGKKVRPQLINACVCMTAASIAAVTCDHLEPPPLAGGSFIDPDLSSTMSTSGGRLCNWNVCTPQFMPPAPPVPAPLDPPVLPPAPPDAPPAPPDAPPAPPEPPVVVTS